MSNIFFNYAKVALLNGEFDLANDSLRVALVSSIYEANKVTDRFFSDVSGEVDGAGYVAGGKALANVSVDQDDANNRAVLSADDITWALATLTARAAVVYKDSGDPQSNLLLAYIDFSEDKSAEGEDFTIQWHQDGVVYVGELI